MISTLIHFHQLQFFFNQRQNSIASSSSKPLCLRNRIQRRFEKIRRADAGNLDGILKREKNSFARAHLGAHGQKIFAAINDFTAGHFIIFPARQNMRQRAFTRTVRTHDGVHFAGADVQIDAAQNFLISNLCPEPANIQAC